MATEGRPAAARVEGFAIARWFDSEVSDLFAPHRALRRLMGRISYQVTTCVNGPSSDRENQRAGKRVGFFLKK
jgi:hypothetical protein